MPVKELMLRGLIGCGGQARIYLGTCEAALVAFKYFIEPSQEATEASFLLSLSEPRIIRAHGLSIDHELRGIVLEYASGSTLRLIFNVMAELALKPSPGAVAYVAHEIDRALRYLHRAQITHNDLSPANMLFLPDGRLKLCDFGAATLLGNKNSLGFAFGKRPYMALELLQGGEASFSSDYYALAAVLIEFFTGQHFRQADPSASFSLMADLKYSLPALFDWIVRSLAPLRSLRPRHDLFPAFADKLLLEGKDELRQLVKLAPVIIESAGDLEGKVIDFVTFLSAARRII